MARINWRIIWLICWGLILILDQFLDLRGQITVLIGGAEQKDPGVFHHRLQTGLLVLIALIALAPLCWPLARRLFLRDAPAPRTRVEHDPRDMNAAEAVGYLVHKSAWAASTGGEEESLTKAAAETLEDAARKGGIVFRGVPPGGGSRETVPAEFWLTSGLDLDATLNPSGSGGQTAPRQGTKTNRRGDRTPKYTALVIDRESVRKRWPEDNLWRRTGRSAARGMRLSRRPAPSDD